MKKTCMLLMLILLAGLYAFAAAEDAQVIGNTQKTAFVLKL